MQSLFIMLISILKFYSIEMKDAKIISIPYYLFNGLCIRIDVPRYRASGFSEINQQIDSSYINLGYDIKNVSSLDHDTITINDKAKVRFFFNEEIAMESNIHLPLHFYFISNSSLNNIVYNGISFPFNPTNEKFSFMHILYNQHKIDKLTYAIGQYHSTEGTLYLGGVPNEAIINKFKGECDVIYNKWGCELDQVFFSYDNNTNRHLYQYNNTKRYKALFQAGYKYIYAPRDYIQHLIDIVFKSYFDNHTCIYQNSTFFRALTIKCEIKNIDNFFPDKINFVFNGYVYPIEIKSLFHLYRELDGKLVYFFDVVESMEDNENDVWIFGSLFLKNFFSVYDYEDKKITFYSQMPLEHIDIVKFDSIYDNTLTLYLYLDIFVIIIGIFVNCVIIKKLY